METSQGRETGAVILNFDPDPDLGSILDPRSCPVVLNPENLACDLVSSSDMMRSSKREKCKIMRQGERNNGTSHQSVKELDSGLHAEGRKW